MSFTFNCPICNQSLEAEEEWIGQQGECPGCGQTVTIKKKLSLKTKEQSPSYEPTKLRETASSFNPAGDSYQAVNYQAYNDHFHDVQSQNDAHRHGTKEKSSALVFIFSVGIGVVFILFVGAMMDDMGWLSMNTVSSSSTASNSSTNSSNAYQEMAEDTKTQTAKLVFITNCIVGNNRITPQTEIYYVKLEEKSLIESEISKLLQDIDGGLQQYYDYEDKWNEYLKRGKRDEYDKKSLIQKQSEVYGKIFENIIRYLKLINNWGTGKRITIYDFENAKEISELEIGTMVYVCAFASWKDETIFWCKKTKIRSGENQLIFRFDVSGAVFETKVLNMALKEENK